MSPRQYRAQRARFGYLEYDYGAKRGGNVGGNIILDTVRAAGLNISPCLPDQINQYDLVLVSLPSTYQVLDYLRIARQHHFDKRTCKILLGGFGLQNPIPMSDYYDYAFFGRAHDIIIDLLISLVTDGDYDRAHMLTPSMDNAISIRQAPLMSNDIFEEEFTGCNLKCKFCHYTYARKYTGEGSSYVQTLLTGGGTPEVLYADIMGLDEKPGRLRTALDGFSQRVRYLYGKRISNDLIVDGINHLGYLADKHSKTGSKNTVVTCYNIANFPGETAADELEFAANIARADPVQRVIFILHTTPFRPSPATPMQWEPVSIWPQWSDKREHTWVDRPNLLVKYSFTLEGAWSHLMSILVERARYEDIELLLSAQSWKRSKRAGERAQSFMDAHDLSYHLGEHDIDKPSPTWWLNGYIREDVIRKIAHKMRAERYSWSGKQYDRYKPPKLVDVARPCLSSHQSMVAAVV